MELDLDCKKKDQELKNLNDYCLQLNDENLQINEKKKTCEIELQRLNKNHQELNEIYLKNFQLIIEENKLTNSLREKHAVEIDSLNNEIM